MTLNIANFNVVNRNGLMKINGRINSETLSSYLSIRTIIPTLKNKEPVSGMPLMITNEILKNKSHPAKNYIRIIKNYGKYFSTESLFMRENKIRIIKIGGICQFKNMLLYAFSPFENTPPEKLYWKVIFANTTEHKIGDFVEISINDDTNHPNTYITFILISNGWYYTNIELDTLTCSLTDVNIKYYCINPMFSNTDVNLSHAVYINAYNNSEGIHTRHIIAWEDKEFSLADKDYNDVVIAITSSNIEECQINEDLLR